MSSLFCAVPLLASLLSCPSGSAVWLGYVEGDYALLAPVETAAITHILVRRGDHAAAGQPLVELEKSDAGIAVAAASASLAEAGSQLADLKTGRRPEEIAAIAAGLDAAEAQAAQARANMARSTQLIETNATSRADFEAAEAALKTADANVAAARANLAVANLPARADQIAAAENAEKVAARALDTARWRLAQRTLSMPVPVTVEDLVRHDGEMAGPQAPVLSLLPDGAVKLRVYVPEDEVHALHVGSRLAVTCDGCAPGQGATVSFIDSGPQFTPPVIYSQDSRQKLVYLVEARPDETAAGLKPGQIVDVAAQPAGGSGP